MFKVSSLIAVIFSLAGFQANAYKIEAHKGHRKYGMPIHESMTELALEKSNFLNEDPSITRIIIDGVRFNDAPEGDLIIGAEANMSTSTLLPWLSNFMGTYKPAKDANDATKASHFGKFQFLHAMAPTGTPRHHVRRNIKLYLYHCWRMATLENSLLKFKREYTDLLNKLKRERTGESLSFADYGRDEVFLRRVVQTFPKEVLFFHATNQKEFQYRALGALLHVIQDSYSMSHVVRVGWETGDNSGPIRYFQSYEVQDSHKHSDHDDDSLLGKADQGGEQALMKIGGVKSAIEKSTHLLEMIKNKCPWTLTQPQNHPNCNQGIFGFLDSQVFPLANPIPSSDTTTDSHTHPDLKFEPVDDCDHLEGFEFNC